MSTKHELASYLANLSTILEVRERKSPQRDKLLTLEYERTYQQYLRAILSEATTPQLPLPLPESSSRPAAAPVPNVMRRS